MNTYSAAQARKASRINHSLIRELECMSDLYQRTMRTIRDAMECGLFDIFIEVDIEMYPNLEVEIQRVTKALKILGYEYQIVRCDYDNRLPLTYEIRVAWDK